MNFEGVYAFYCCSILKIRNKDDIFFLLFLFYFFGLKVYGLIMETMKLLNWLLVGYGLFFFFFFLNANIFFFQKNSMFNFDL